MNSAHPPSDKYSERDTRIEGGELSVGRGGYYCGK